MIELKELRKSYKTGDFVQKALDGVSLNFRDNEFVAVLGPSGSGKTTLLNVLGGLDHADSGDIVINGTSTRNYRSSDWDTYRNHRIGFIFQSYNLIPHQTILANVELALTLSGVGRAERKRRATAALARVGLGEQVHKKPAQLSGGQMQRVAIARALVNDPEIVLADEPTGALDTETGIQVMNLLQEIAKDRLVIMVTHNPELAEEYATRIVRLADGRIMSDTDPFDGRVAPDVPAARAAWPASPAPAAPAPASVAPGTTPASAPIFAPAVIPASDVPLASEAVVPPGARTVVPAASVVPVAPAAPVDRKKNAKRARMSFLTALGLSFNNLMTKKGRTFMTAFAGSIGIIGIAAILSLSNGVNNYIADTEEQALTSYPLTITKSSFDFSSMLAGSMGLGGDEEDDEQTPFEKIAAAREEAAQGAATKVRETDTIPEVSIMTDMFARVKSNDLREFRAFLESGESGVEPYVNTIHYAYGINPIVYDADTAERVLCLTSSRLNNMLSGSMTGSELFGFTSSASIFQRLLDDEDVVRNQMDLVLGQWPQEYDEALLVLSSTGRITDYTLYSLGYYDPDVMDTMAQQALEGEEVVAPETAQDFSYEDALNMSFLVLPSSSAFQRNETTNTWTDISSDDAAMRRVLESDAVRLKIVGVVQPKDAQSSLLTQGVAYKGDLLYHLIDQAAESDIVKQQMADPETDVFTGKTFDELQSEQGSQFDMENIFSIDEEALTSAFQMDASAFEGMDFSGLDLDMGDLDLDDLDIESLIGELDFSDIDTSSLSETLDEDAMRTIMEGAPQFDFDLAAALADAQEVPDPQDVQELNEGANRLAAGFFAWASENDRLPLAEDESFADLFAEYVATDEEAQAFLTGLAQQAGSAYGTDVSGLLTGALTDYLTNDFAPYMQTAMGDLMAQAAQAVATQMADSMARQLSGALEQVGNSVGSQIANSLADELGGQVSLLSDSLQEGFNFDADAFGNAIQFNMTQEDLTSLLTNFMNAEELSYDANLKKLGYADLENPESISIYPKDFPSKESVIGVIDEYNARQTAAGNEDSTIQYSDIAGTLMSSVTDIVDTISLVLIAFVSISLVVSSIMIGIITYISVLERKKEIGILRAMGASKGNVASVFNAETVIEGLIAGALAIGVVVGVSVPVNAIVEAGWDVPNVMSLPLDAAIILIGLSVLLTFVAGLLPSQSAARRDPVEALRSE